MSGDKESPEGEKIGYGQPPTSGRFKKGRSGNIRGRPRKQGGVDLADLLDEPVTVRVGGLPKQKPAKEIALRQLVKRALEGDRRAIIRLLDQFELHGVFVKQAPLKNADSVLVLPVSRMPFPMGVSMTLFFGLPPWSKTQLAKGRAMYLATRNGRQAQIDDAIDYPDLAQGTAT